MSLPEPWERLEEKSDVSTKLVWHYTDASGLLGILSNNVLWASSAVQMNDSAELKHGMQRLDAVLASSSLSAFEQKFVQDQLDEARERLLRSETYILSASRKGDSLSQWRAYGGESGYAVGLDRDEPLSLLASYNLHHNGTDYEDYVRDLAYVSPWRTVLYRSQDQNALAEKFVRDIASFAPVPGASAWKAGKNWNRLMAVAFMGVTRYTEAVTRMKDSGFADEQEVRIVAQALDDRRFQHIRAGRYGLNPYVKVASTTLAKSVKRSSFSTLKAKRLPIREVRIGPTPYLDSATAGLKTTLERFGYSDVKIRLSRVPYR